MKYILYILFIITLSIQVQAQDDKIITVQGDTLLGKVSVFSNNNSFETIVLKNGREKTVFKVYQVKSLMIDKDVYHTIRIDGLYQLGKLKKEGYLSLYNYTASGDDTSRPFSSSILVKLDGSQQVVPNLGFKKRIVEFLEDCDMVVANFEADAYKKTELNKIIDDYNECINENTAKFDQEISESNSNREKVEQIKVLITNIQKDETLNNTDTLIEMLNDVMDKLKNNTKIPSYLENALRESLKKNSNYLDQFSKILEDE